MKISVMFGLSFVSLTALADFKTLKSDLWNTIVEQCGEVQWNDPTNRGCSKDARERVAMLFEAQLAPGFIPTRLYSGPVIRLERAP